jgi:hypothetical protein
LAGTNSGTVAWGDYDHDGDLDFFVAGVNNWPEYSTKVYENISGQFMLAHTLNGGIGGEAEWGDYDNDGDLDIVLTGQGNIGTNPVWFSAVYRNDVSAFRDVKSGLPKPQNGSLSLGDFNADSKLDLVVHGYDSITKLFRNNIHNVNTPPNAPTGLLSIVAGDSVRLSWRPSTDTETASRGITYNLRVGTSRPGSEIMSAMADLPSGFRRLPCIGNVNHDTSWTIKNLSPGKYYWSVQSVDNSFSGSPFSSLDSFTIDLGVVAALKAFLQGPYIGSAMGTALASGGLIPASQPYSGAPWNYPGTETVSPVPAGMVDWVLLELRSDQTTVVARRAALILSDGTIVDTDGSSPVTFDGVSNGSYYLVVKHRNHLAIMSSSAVPLTGSSSLFDFTTGLDKYHGGDAREVSTGVFGMYAGDANSDGFVTSTDFNVFNPEFTSGASGYRIPDWNLDTFVTSTDFNLFNPNFTTGRQTSVP